MPAYDKIDGVLRPVSRIYDSMGGTLREVSKGYDRIDGVLRQYHSSALELYNRGVKDIPIASQSGNYTYSQGYTCGGWDAGTEIILYPQKFVQNNYGQKPTKIAQVDFEACDWDCNYLCMELYLERTYGMAHFKAKSAPNGTVLKDLSFTSPAHYIGSNSGTGWTTNKNLYYTTWFNRSLTMQGGTVVICADLRKSVTKHWALSLESLADDIGWGVQYSPHWHIYRIWQSDDIPEGLVFDLTYTWVNTKGEAMTSTYPADTYDNVF